MPSVRFAGGIEMWTSEARGRYDRSKLRYPSDLTDDEWALVGPLIPPAKRGGNKRVVVVREIINVTIARTPLRLAGRYRIPLRRVGATRSL